MIMAHVKQLFMNGEIWHRGQEEWQKRADIHPTTKIKMTKKNEVHFLSEKEHHSRALMSELTIGCPLIKHETKT